MGDVSGTDPKPQRFYAEDLQEVSFVHFDGSSVVLEAKGGVIETSDPFAVPRLQELAEADGHPITDQKPPQGEAKVSDTKRERE